MRRAIELAKLGGGHVHPNPLVGAVIVRDGQILAEGYHHKCGDLHAERDCLMNASESNVDVSGAEMYVTLEPCCHTGKQPPCTQAVIESGIKTVIIGTRDPNALVNGRGVRQLEEAGVTVIQDFLREECDAINSIFFHYRRKNFLVYRRKQMDYRGCSSQKCSHYKRNNKRRHVRNQYGSCRQSHA